jgi:hypothetical protein
MTGRFRAVPGCTDPAKGKALEAYLEKALEVQEAEAFEEHYFSCQACLDELGLRQALPEAIKSAAKPSPGVVRWAAAAAGLTAVLLAYPAWLGLVALPGAREQAARSASDASRLRADLADMEFRTTEAEQRYRSALAWDGPVTLTVFSAGLRSTTERKIVRLLPDQPHAVLAFVPPPPRQLTRTDALEVSLSDQQGDDVWKTRILTKQAVEAHQESGTVPFLVPAERLPDGTYHLLVRHAGGGAVLLDTSFDVRRVSSTSSPL